MGLSPAFGFGPAGHDVVGDIAERHLCRDARVKVSDLLNGDSLGYASRWPDWIRRTPEWEHTAPWHYINVEDDERIADVVGGIRGDVIEATNRYFRKLADARLSRRERGESLRFAAHFLADIHQPLHVGRLGDRGGNRIDVFISGERTNLHALWDAEYLLDTYGLERRALADLLETQLRGKADRWRGGEPLAWAAESMALRPVVYGPVRGPALRLGEDSRYLRTSRDVVSERLAQAGLRLAHSLNSIFCKSP